ncbi:glycoside hydrolase family 78 protein [Cadophora sp. DSE1049]|nr:glycoside hydrolase family 78 protein [Cadophora sp. DSE1049]
MDWLDITNWIWSPDFDDSVKPGQFVLFRKTFTLDKIPDGPVVLRVSADTRYRCCVNTRSVSFGPCKSYTERWFYEEVDISLNLVVGQNVISVQVLRFSPGALGSFSFTASPLPGLIVHCEVAPGLLLSGDSSWKSKTDASRKIVPRSEWNFALGPAFLGLSERVDGRLVDKGWELPDYDDSAWKHAVPSSMKATMLPVLEPWSLNPRPIPMLPEIESTFDTTLVAKGFGQAVEAWNELLRNQKTVELPAGSTFVVEVESKVLTTGFIRLLCSGDAAATINIVCAEAYERDMSTGLPRQKTIRSDYENGTLYGPEDTYTTHPGSNTYEPFWFRTFRYIRLTITTSESPLRIDAFNYRATHYPLVTTTSIEPSSSSGLKEIWDISCNTLRNCMHETYEDCPYYEQNQFVMDTRLMLLFTYNLSRDDRLARKTIDEFASSQLPNGLLQTTFPANTRTTSIPQFSLFWVFMIEDHYQYFNDKRLVKRSLGTIDRILNYFDAVIDHRGLVGRFPGGDVWAFVDWVGQWFRPGGMKNMCIPPTYNKHGAATYNSLIYVIALHSAARICALVGRKDTAAEYTARADNLNQRINEHCYDGMWYLDGPGVRDSPGLQDRSQHSQIFAVLSGAIAGDAAKELILRTFRTPGLARASFPMLFYAFRAAAKAGVYDELFPDLIQPWRQMLEDKLTTCKESDAMHRSDCHGWSATPIYEVIGELMGVTPPDTNATRPRIAPRVKLLENFKGSVVLKSARITVAWNETGILTVESDTDTDVDVVLGGKIENLFLKSGVAATLRI